ncbi:extracellular catalytic domain type 1 short-chain-length polyhydroxyalkanoate depolymerase [Massilia horti]|uniref:PHB depolymerase family esterase n=1 Tax=Massilia horti TaxID=2562153 RepID=A0A4Y9SPU6_9BURK|nr:PHB depolymerase family esterase [Massilia horti]TFW27497.1 PHB depolymerase family esterase [Massilia horti]
MKLSDRFLAQLRAATQTWFRRGPDATATAMQSALQDASRVQQAMLDLIPAPDRLASQPPAEPARVAKEIVPEMLAELRLTKLGRLDTVADLLDAATPQARAQALPGSFIDGSYTNEAGTRGYKLYVPGNYTGLPAALVVMLHGCVQDPDDFAAGTQMNALAEEHGFLVVYPAQSPQANATRCWNWFNAIHQQRDQGEPSIIAGITRDIMARYCVDQARVYVAGMSAGGAMATIMGTLYPDLYAAVGVHSGLPFASAHDLPSALAAMKGDFLRRSEPGHALPIIVFHGDKDTTVHPANGEHLIELARHASIDVAVEPGTVPQGYAYTRTVHQREDGRVHAEHWVIHGAGHAWSGGDARGSYTDGKGPDASREMLRFFRTHS